MKKYKNCTDYWLDTENMSFRGEFERMYQDIDDPWGCNEGSNSLNNRIFTELLFYKRKFKRILDIGCGLGGFTNYISLKNGGEIIGCDISQTAIKKAVVSYPKVNFAVINILTDDISDLGKFDLIIFSEVLWYILEDIEGVFFKINDSLRNDGVIGIHQYFPDKQNYGSAVIDGLESFSEFIEKKTPFKIRQKLLSYGQLEGKVLLSDLERK